LAHLIKDHLQAFMLSHGLVSRKPYFLLRAV
jgi:hypothetical protein